MARAASPPTEINVATHPNWDVLLDGKLVALAYAANSDEGWVDHYKPHPETGGPYIEFGRAAWERLHGRVTILPGSELICQPRSSHTRIPWWHRILAAVGLLVPALAIALIVAGLMSMAGCAVGYTPNPDGTPNYSDPVIGTRASSINTAGGGTLSLAGFLSGNPLIAAGLAAVVGRATGVTAGRHVGWEEKQDDELKRRGIVATKESP